MKRIFEFWAGAQGSGKTYRLRIRIKELAARPSITSVFVCDRIGEYEDTGQCFRSMSEYFERETIPRVCVFSFGLNPELYEPVFREAVEQGNVVICLDEAHEFSPAGATWRGSETLQRAVLAGRHIRNCKNEMCKIHLLMATQYPRQCHHSMWSQAETVYTSKLRGDLSRDWIRGNFGKEAMLHNKLLKDHVFQRLRPEKKIFDK
jgi:hypothetical protein